MPCWPAWRSPCCLEPTRPFDSWPGDALSSVARWYRSHCPLLPSAVVSNHCVSALMARSFLKLSHQLPDKVSEMRFQMCSGCLSSCLELLWVLLSCVSFCPQESEDDHKLPALNLLICLVARFDS